MYGEQVACLFLEFHITLLPYIVIILLKIYEPSTNDILESIQVSLKKIYELNNRSTLKGPPIWFVEQVI